MDLLLLDYSNISKIIAPIGRSDLVRYLQSIVRPHVVRRAAAGVDDVAPVSPCQTVSPVLLHLTVSHPLLRQGGVGTVNLFYKRPQDSLGEPHPQVLIPADQVERVDSKSLRENGGLGFIAGALLLAASRRRWCSW